jgi:hypothetical protein
MKRDQLVKLKRIQTHLNMPWIKESISLNGRNLTLLYSPECGLIHIHICEKKDDIKASKNGSW